VQIKFVGKGVQVTGERIRSMDVLRALAIILVLVAHLVLGYGAPQSFAFLQFGGLGVDLFFVLSGWLLGGQLFKQAKQKNINVLEFWRRRWYRTLPAYYFVLMLTIFQQYVTKSDFKSPIEYLFCCKIMVFR